MDFDDIIITVTLIGRNSGQKTVHEGLPKGKLLRFFGEKHSDRNGSHIEI
jgi:hypothetical protein